MHVLAIAQAHNSQLYRPTLPARSLQTRCGMLQRFTIATISTRKLHSLLLIKQCLDASPSLTSWAATTLET